MRIFIGIKLDDTVLDNIERFLKPFKKIASPLKWTTRENLHITLKFIGEVSAEKCNQIENLLADTNFNTGALNININSCGKFGKGPEINILWTGPEKNQQLEDMFNRIENILLKVGIPKDERPFKPHITVARNKKPFNGKPFFKLIDENNGRLIAGSTITHFQLFNSRLTPQGPIYNILKEIPVNG